MQTSKYPVTYLFRLQIIFSYEAFGTRTEHKMKYTPSLEVEARISSAAKLSWLRIYHKQAWVHATKRSKNDNTNYNTRGSLQTGDEGSRTKRRFLGWLSLDSKRENESDSTISNVLKSSADRRARVCIRRARIKYSTSWNIVRPWEVKTLYGVLTASRCDYETNIIRQRYTKAILRIYNTNTNTRRAAVFTCYRIY